MAAENLSSGKHVYQQESLPGTRLHEVVDGPDGIRMLVDLNHSGNALNRVDTSRIPISSEDINAHPLSIEQVKAAQEYENAQKLLRQKSEQAEQTPHPAAHVYTAEELKAMAEGEFRKAVGKNWSTIDAHNAVSVANYEALKAERQRRGWPMPKE